MSDRRILVVLFYLCSSFRGDPVQVLSPCGAPCRSHRRGARGWAGLRKVTGGDRGGRQLALFSTTREKLVFSSGPAQLSSSLAFLGVVP